MNSIREFFLKIYSFFRQRKVRRALRTAESVADTVAFGVGAVLRTVVRIVATVLLVFVTTGLLCVSIFAVYVKTCMTEGLDVSLEEASLSLSSTIWYKETDGSWREMTKLYSLENRTWVELENIPQDMQHAAVAIEDKRFYEHKGVDWYRTAGAFVNMFVGMNNTFGGSTLTQQLIKNLTEYDDVTVQRKLLEIFRALEFEKKYTKDEIMTWYLNEIYLGEGCYGVGSAANTYFGKNVWELSLAECATLVGITNNPSAYDPYIYPENCEMRRNTILRQMYEQSYITYEQYDEAVNTPIVLDHSESVNSSAGIYTWYEEMIIRDAIADLSAAKGVSTSVAERLLYSGGYNIYACVDVRIQNILDNYFQNLANLPRAYRTSSQQLRAAMVIIEPSTGDIVGIGGDVGEKNQNMLLNLATMAKRPPGSSFKPLAVYSPAIDTGIINQNTTFNDSPGLRLKGTSWYPRNSGGYGGVMTVHNALVQSKNTVAAQILDAIGLATSWDYLTNHYGITSLVWETTRDDGSTYTDYAYAPLALGQLSEGITVREMAQAYTAFVNGGVMSYGRSYSVITDQDGNLVYDNVTRTINALKPNTAANMCQMLQDAVSYGTGTEARISQTAVGGKTGTTDSDKDRYFSGITMYYTASVWTGYETPEKMYFSGNPACQIFRTVMSQVLSGYSYWSFPAATINAASMKGPELDKEEEEEEESEPTPAPTPAPTEPPVETAKPTEVPTETTRPADPTAAPTPTSPPAQPPECSHNWEANYTHHDAVYEAVTVTDYITVTTYTCSSCGAPFGSQGDFDAHNSSSHEGGATCSTSTSQVASGSHTEQQLVSAAYDELTGYTCSLCGATKGP